jgi:hypothetical protein
VENMRLFTLDEARGIKSVITELRADLNESAPDESLRVDKKYVELFKAIDKAMNKANFLVDAMQA